METEFVFNPITGEFDMVRKGSGSGSGSDSGTEQSTIKWESF